MKLKRLAILTWILLFPFLFEGELLLSLCKCHHGQASKRTQFAESDSCHSSFPLPQDCCSQSSSSTKCCHKKLSTNPITPLLGASSSSSQALWHLSLLQVTLLPLSSFSFSPAILFQTLPSFSCSHNLPLLL